MPGGGLTLKNQMLEFQTAENAVCCAPCMSVCVWWGMGYVQVLRPTNLKVTEYANQSSTKKKTIKRDEKETYVDIVS